MLKILIADDHEIVRRGLKLTLLEEYPSAHIEEAEHGEMLVTKTREAVWDIIITDISMPVMNGLEALREIRKHRLHFPVLILSMHTEDYYCISALKAGASGYLSKAMAQQELVNAVRKILSGKKYIPDALILKLGELPYPSTDTKPHLLLSERELSVLKLLASGKSITEISELLLLGASTISTYRSRLLEKMNMHANADITRYALENHLI